jgi:hypothetical protein
MFPQFAVYADAQLRVAPGRPAMPSSTFWALAIVALVVVLAVQIALPEFLYALPRQRRALYVSLFLALWLVFLYFAPTRNPAQRRSEQIIWGTVLGILGLVFAASNLTRRRASRKFADWAITHGFKVKSATRSPSQETLPQNLRQLHLMCTGRESDTFFVLEENDQAHDFRTTIFGFSTSWISFSPWALRRVRRSIAVTVYAFGRRRLELPAFELRPTASAETQPDDDAAWPLVVLSGKRQLAERYMLRSPHWAEVERILRDDVVAALVQDPWWCLEALGEWCIAYRYHHATTFWTMRPSGFEYCTNQDELSARLETARRLYALIAARLDRSRERSSRLPPI